MLFWTGAVVIPLLLYLGAAIFRRYSGLPQTSAADALALIIIFDGTAILGVEEFAKLANNATPTNMLAFAVIFLIVAMACWGFALLALEPRVLASHTSRSRNINFPLIPWVSIWLIWASIIAVHVALFTGRLSI